MLTKILIFLGVVLGVLIVARLGSAAVRPRPPAPPERAVEDLKRCPDCGAYTALGSPCACGGGRPR